MTLEDAVRRIIDEVRPRITRPHDVTRIEIDPHGITVHVLERDSEGYMVVNKTGSLRTVAEIVRHKEIRIVLMETDE